MNHSVKVALGGRGYAIHIGANLLASAAQLLPALAEPRAVIVTDSNVAPLYLDALAANLHSAGIEVGSVVIPAGESHKDWHNLNRIFDYLLASGYGRGTTLIALGGGVVGDVAGFAAASYQRGVPLVQMPTTLLAQVDSSVGGKTAINHPLGKNMIGAFHQPRMVIADTTTLATLPDSELRAGIAEVIKHGLLGDAEFFAWLEQHMDELLAREPRALAHAIRRSCEMKAEIVAQDEREAGIRAHLNLGHTFGHAIEAGLGFGVWLHGEAVAAGMVMAAELSRRLGMIQVEDVQRIKSLLVRAGLPHAGPRLGAETYVELMRRDKKAVAGEIRYVLLKRIGEAAVAPAPDALVREVITVCEAGGTAHV
jgi:3-dehydroquinate synthase